MSWFSRWEHLCVPPTVDGDVRETRVWRCRCGRRFMLMSNDYPGHFEELAPQPKPKPEPKKEDQDDDLFAFLEGSW